MELLDIVDTAVKIGLGATISGITAFFVGRSNHKNEKNRFLLEHKLQTIEMATEGFEEYFKCWNKFLSQVSGIERWRRDNEKCDEPYADSQTKVIKERNEDLTESWQARDLAVSKLRLLSAQKPLDALNDITLIEKKLRDSIVFDNETPDYETVQEAKIQSKNFIKKFHKELAAFYLLLGT